MREQFHTDRGASIFLLAISLFLLIGASAVAVDIAAIWLDRSTDQKVTDAAAAVGILEAYETGGQAACEAALNYVAANTPDLSSVSTAGCGAFSSGCDDTLIDRKITVSEGRYDITVVYPVDSGNDLMTSRIISRTPQSLVAADGDPCERLGVRMDSTRNSLFAQVLGFGSGSTRVHTVAVRIPGDDRPPLNLIVLDRTGCNAISVNGGGQIIALPVIDYDPDTGVPRGLVPGLVIADSDGTGSFCGGSGGVINVSGNGSVIRADGPFCDNGQPTYTFAGFQAQEGCGTIKVLAPNNPGPCSPPACSISGGGNAPNPAPSPLGSPYTRQPADWRYNCYPDYTNPPNPPSTTWAADALTTTNKQNIEGCEDWDPTASGGRGNDYIYNLIDDVNATGLPDGSLGAFNVWPASACNFGGTGTFNGNFVVDCNLTVNGDLTINGNVVFSRNVSVNGSLTINTPDDNPWIFFRGGTLKKAGGGSLTFADSMVYMAKGSDVQLSGGAGPLTWTAPTTGGYENFQGLALWSDSTAAQTWSGQAGLTLSGVFFMPRAPVSYSGGGALDQTNAQWLAWRLSVGGGGVLKMAPAEGTLQFPSDRSELIR